MGKITGFTLDDYFRIEETYNDIITQIMRRAEEIATDCGKIDDTWAAIRVDIEKLDGKNSIRVVFGNNCVPKRSVVFDCAESLLFSDDYKKQLELEPLRSRVERNRRRLEEEKN